MKPFKLKENRLIPYNYNLNRVLFNQDRTVPLQSLRVVYASEFSGNLMARTQHKPISNL